MPLQHPPVEGLAQAVGGDKAEAADRAGAGQFGRLLPPVHDIVGGLGDLRPGAAQGLDIAVTQGAAHRGGADEGRIADHKIGGRPVRPARIDIALQRHPRGVVRDRLAGDRVRLEGPAVPAGDGLALVVQDPVHAVIVEHGVAADDVAEVADHGLRRVDRTVGPKVPLQVADPQHHLGDGGGAGVEFEPEQLVGVDADALHRHQQLALTE